MIDVIEQRLWIDPEEGLGKFCPICGAEHFNAGEFCTKCTDRMTDYDDE